MTLPKHIEVYIKVWLGKSFCTSKSMWIQLIINYLRAHLLLWWSEFESRWSLYIVFSYLKSTPVNDKEDGWPIYLGKTLTYFTFTTTGLVNAVWPDVELKSIPIFPKSSHSSFYFKIAQEVTNFLATFVKKLSPQTFAQSGRTVCWRHPEYKCDVSSWQTQARVNSDSFKAEQ